MKSYTEFLKEDDKEDVEDIAHWRHLPNTQYGSNPGGVHEDPTGKKHYVKFYRDPEQARSEVAASKIYEKLGVNTVKPRLVQMDGKLGVASKWRSDLTRIKPNAFAGHIQKSPEQFAAQYHAAVLTGNRDQIGLEYGNVMSGPFGKFHTVDLGGTFRHRAMGEPKQYGPESDEADGLLVPTRPAGHVFKNLTPEHMKSGLQSIDNVKDSDLKDIFKHMKNPDELAKSFKGRVKSLKKRYG